MLSNTFRQCTQGGLDSTGVSPDDEKRDGSLQMIPALTSEVFICLLKMSEQESQVSN